MKKVEKNNIDIDPKEISDVMVKGEEIVWQGRPKRSAFFAGNIFGMLHIALLFAIFGGLLIYFCVQKGIFGGRLTFLSFFLGAFLVIFFLPVWAWFFHCVTTLPQFRHCEYVLTDRRVIAKKWKWGRYIETERYKDVVMIDYVFRRTGKIFGAGDVIVVCKDKKIVLRDLEDPADTAKKLRMIVKAAKEGGKLS